MTRLNLTLFGGFQARLGRGLPLRLRTRKTEALLAYLARPPGQGHPRDKLAALLWSNCSPPQARSRLRETLFVLRRALSSADPPCLELNGETLALSADVVDVDVVAFEQLVQAGEPEALARAAELYQGELLEGLAFRGVLFEDWLLAERERLRELALEALAKLLAHQRSAGRPEAALQTALRLVALDPLQEPVHRTLMRLYADLGRRGAALRQYQRCVGVLRRELGVEPEAESRQLYQQILRRRLEGDPDREAIRTSDGREPSPVRSELAAPSTPLIGRADAVAMLRQALAQALTGDGRHVAIVGEAGVGKTRLVAEIVAEASARDVHVLLGRSYESDQILPFGPWVDAIRTAGLTSDRGLLAELAPAWRAELTRLLPEIDGSGVPAPGGNQLRLFESVALLLERVAVRQPVLLVLEDLHWADEMTLRLLAFVTRRTHAMRLLVLVTARDDEGPGAGAAHRALQALGPPPHVGHLTVSPLSRADTGRLTRTIARAGMDALAEARLEERVWAASEGNPFVAIETTRALEEGALRLDGAMSSVPQRVRDLIAGRLARLSGPARQLAAVAAVIGRGFDFALLQQAGGLGEETTAEGVEELARNHVLLVVGERLEFSHQRVQAVVYSQMLPAQRRVRHRRVGGALEALYTDNLEPHFLALSTHFREGEVWHKAVTYLHQAGTQALARSAHREAATCFEQALAALEHLPETSDLLVQALDVRFDLTSALFQLGAFEPIVAYLREAEGPARRLGDQRRLGQLSVHMCRILVLAGHPTEAIAFGENAQTIAKALGDVVLLVRASLALGGAYSRTGEYPRAEDLLLKLLRLLEGDPSGERSGVGAVPITARCFLSSICADQGRFTKGIAHGHEGLRLAEALDDPTNLAAVYWYLAHLQIARGELHKAVGLAERGRALARQWNLPYLSVLHSGSLGYAYVLLGRTAEGIPLLEHAMNALGTMGHRSGQALLILHLGEACVLAGRLEDALALAEQGLALARERGQRGYEAWALRLLGEIASRRDPPHADGPYRDALALAEELEMRPLVAHCHLGLGTLYRRISDQAKAEEHLATARTMYREMDMALWLEKAGSELGSPDEKSS